MNQFFFETRGKEKIRDLREEGMRGQALRRSSAARRLVFDVSKLALALLGLLVILNLVGH